MALPQVVDMGGPLFFPDGIIPRLYGRRHFRHLRHPDPGRGKAPDVVRRPPGIDDIRRHFGLEGAFARERDDAVEIGPVDSEPFRQRADVQVVLAQRVPEAALLPVDRLRPLGAILIAENPPRIVLRLDDKDAVLRHDDVVDLRRRPVRQGEVNVVKNDVLFRQTLSKPVGDRSFAALPFPAGRLQPRGKNLHRKQHRKHPQDADNHR